MASTIFSHNAGVSCRENYDTVSSMKKKKKKEREREKKYNETAYASEATAFRSSRFTRFPWQTNCGELDSRCYATNKKKKKDMTVTRR